MIEAGRVTIDGAPAGKAATLVASGAALVVAAPPARYVSRGAHKLVGALDDLAVGVSGRSCLDAGASTGGFTDVLLQRGAASVVAVDVGYGQLAWSLRVDPRVLVLERTNVRHLDVADVPPPAPDLVVADLSFISLTVVLPALRSVAAANADHLLMVKPQFEAGRVGKGGVVRDPEVWRAAVEGVAGAGAALGLGAAGVTVSPLPGPAGNVEFFLHLHAAAPPLAADGVDAAIAAGIALRGR